MSSVKDLEKERGKAQVSHGRAIQKLRKVCNVDNPNPRAVKVALDALESEFEKLQDRHVAFVMKSGTTLENPANANWMNNRSEEHENAEEAANVILGYLEIENDVPVPVAPAGPNLQV